MNKLKRTAMLLAVSLTALLVVACGTPDPTADNSGEAINERCIDGVRYLFFKGQLGYAGYGYMSVKFNADSTVSACN